MAREVLVARAGVASALFKGIAEMRDEMAQKEAKERRRLKKLKEKKAAKKKLREEREDEATDE